MLLLDRNNGRKLWADATANHMTALERLGVLQFYPPKTKFEKKDGWKYEPMHMILDAKQQYLLHKARLVVSGHVLDSTEHTTYSSTIKDVSMKLMLLIAVKAGYIGKKFVRPHVLKAFGTSVVHSFVLYGSVMVLKRALYGLKAASNSF